MFVSVPKNQKDIDDVNNYAHVNAFNDLKKQFPEIPWTDDLFDDLWGELSQRFTPKTRRYVRDCFFKHFDNHLKDS